MIIPKIYNSWFKGDLPDGSSTVINCFLYKGNYPQYFTHVLQLKAPNTIKGYIEQAVNLIN